MEKKCTLLKVNELHMDVTLLGLGGDSAPRERTFLSSCSSAVLDSCWSQPLHKRRARGKKFHTALPRDCRGGRENAIGWFCMDKSSIGKRGLSGPPCLRCRGAGGERWETLKAMCRQRCSGRVRVGANAAAAFGTTAMFRFVTCQFNAASYYR